MDSDRTRAACQSEGNKHADSKSLQLTANSLLMTGSRLIPF